MPFIPLGPASRKKRKTAQTELLNRSLRPLSAVRLCEQRTAGGAALREQRERKPSEKSREIAADRVNFPACGALNWLACGAFLRPAALFVRPAAPNEPGQRARPAVTLYSLACSRGVDRVCEQMAASKSTCCCTAARFAPLSFLLPAGCNSYGSVVLWLKQKTAAPFA